MNSQKSMTTYFRIEYPRFKIWLILDNESDESDESVVLLSNNKIQNGFKSLHGKVRLPHENLKAAVLRVSGWLIGHEVTKTIYNEFDSIEKLGDPISFSFHSSKNGRLVHVNCQHYKIKIPYTAKEFMDIVPENKKSQIKIVLSEDILRMRRYNRNRIPSSEELILYREDIECVKNIFAGQTQLAPLFLFLKITLLVR